MKRGLRTFGKFHVGPLLKHLYFTKYTYFANCSYVGALVVVHVAPHVVPQVTLDGELLVAGDAGKGVALLLLEAVVHELDSVGEQSSASWAANKTLLAVTPEMFLMRVLRFKTLIHIFTTP